MEYMRILKLDVLNLFQKGRNNICELININIYKYKLFIHLIIIILFNLILPYLI